MSVEDLSVTPNQFTLATGPISQPDIVPAATAPSVHYQTPDRDSGQAGNLMALAKGLSDMDAGLGRFVRQREDEQAQADKLRGEADFYRNNQAGYAEAVQSGKIPAFASPSYVAAYKQAQGSVAGSDLINKFNAAYDAWGDKTSTDPAAYQTFVREFLSQNISTDDPEVLKGLVPAITQLQQQGLGRHISDLHTATVNGSVNAHVAQGNQTVEAERLKSVQTGKDIDLDSAWNKVVEGRNNFIKSGGTADQIDNKLIDMITSSALQARGQGGPEILTLLDRNVPGTNYTFAQTTYGAAQKVSTTNQLLSWGRQAIADAKSQKDEADKKELGDVTRRTLDSLAQDPSKPIPDALIAQGSKIDPQFRTHVLGWQNTMLSNAGNSDPRDILALNWAILNGGGTDAIRTAMEQGTIRNADELRTAQTLAAQVEKNKPVIDNIMGSPSAKIIVDTIKQRTLSSKDLAQFFAPDGMSDTGLALRFTFNQMLLDWADKHPTATEQEKQAAISTIGKSVLDMIEGQEGGRKTLGPGASSPFGAGRDPNAVPAPGRMGPLAPGLPGTPTSSPPAAQPAPSSPTAGPNGGATPVSPGPSQPQGGSPAQPVGAPPDPKAVKAWVDTLDVTRQQKILDYAQRNRIDPREAAARFYTANQKAAQEAGTAATGPLPPAGQQSPSTEPPPVVPNADEAVRRISEAFNNWRETDPASETVLAGLRTSFLNALHGGAGTGASGSYTVAALKDNPRAARVLDFVSGPESRGNYNAYFGNAGSAKDLSGMTVNQVLAWQKARADAGEPSTATGRYQIIQGTLQRLKTQMGLTGQEKFTPEMQDNLALQLLRNRGLDRWARGQMSDETFANNLAQEWAALPNVHTGRSVYDGVGSNKALVTPRQVLTSLGGARNLPGSPKEQ